MTMLDQVLDEGLGVEPPLPLGDAFDEEARRLPGGVPAGETERPEHGRVVGALEASPHPVQIPEPGRGPEVVRGHATPEHLHDLVVAEVEGELERGPGRPLGSTVEGASRVEEHAHHRGPSPPDRVVDQVARRAQIALQELPHHSRVLVDHRPQGALVAGDDRLEGPVGRCVTGGIARCVGHRAIIAPMGRAVTGCRAAGDRCYVAAPWPTSWRSPRPTSPSSGRRW